MPLCSSVERLKSGGFHVDVVLEVDDAVHAVPLVALGFQAVGPHAETRTKDLQNSSDFLDVHGLLAHDESRRVFGSGFEHRFEPRILRQDHEVDVTTTFEDSVGQVRGHVVSFTEIAFECVQDLVLCLCETFVTRCRAGFRRRFRLFGSRLVEKPQWAHLIPLCQFKIRLSRADSLLWACRRVEQL